MNDKKSAPYEDVEPSFNVYCVFKSLLTSVGNALVNVIEVPTEDPVKVADQFVTPASKPTVVPSTLATILIDQDGPAS